MHIDRTHEITVTREVTGAAGPIFLLGLVAPAALAMTHTVRIANEERSHLIGDTDVDDLPGRFVPLIANTSETQLPHLVLDALQLFPTTGILLAVALLLGKLSKSFRAVMLERTDSATGHNQGLLCVS